MFTSCFSSSVDNDGVKVVAVDLQKMSPLPGVTQIQGDITKVTTVTKLTINMLHCKYRGTFEVVHSLNKGSKLFRK